MVIVLFLVIPLHQCAGFAADPNISLSIMILMITMNISSRWNFFSLPAAHYDSIPAGIKCVLHPSDPQERETPVWSLRRSGI